MKLYKITITPTSDFATTLRGDTLFGQMCWAIFYTFGKEELSKLLKKYTTEPFLVVSDAFPKCYLPKPKIPSTLLGEKSEDKKQNRKKLWLELNELIEGKYSKARTNKDIKNQDKNEMNIHNALNYKTFHTGGEGFDPYGVEVFSLASKDIYFLLDISQLDFIKFKEAFALLSSIGYGKKATIGKGRFEYEEKEDIEEIKIDNTSKAFMTLSPFSPKALVCKDIYYEPFTRFGKFGASRAYKNAFKKPILLADTASVVTFDTPQTHQYLGKAINGLSDVPEYDDTVHQGYSIVLPIGVLNAKL